MFTPEFWSRLDAAAGVPIELAVTDDSVQHNSSGGSTPNGYLVSTKAPLIYARRNGVPPKTALSHIENAIRQTFAEFDLVLPKTALQSIEFTTLFIDMNDDALWHTPPLPYLDVLATRAHDIRMNAPDIHIAKQRLTWHEGVTLIGQDAATWAALNAAKSTSPLTIPDLQVLASRRDENPLALIRRTHAACVIRVEHVRAAQQQVELPQSAVSNLHHPNTQLRATLTWAYRVSYDTKRHQRTRPLTLALHEVAQTVIRYLEQTPVTRTDSLALEAARTLFARSLACAHIAAPVPA